MVPLFRLLDCWLFLFELKYDFSISIDIMHLCYITTEIHTINNSSTSNSNQWQAEKGGNVNTYCILRCVFCFKQSTVSFCFHGLQSLKKKNCSKRDKRKITASNHSYKSTRKPVIEPTSKL